jgi:hypothetical protein
MTQQQRLFRLFVHSQYKHLRKRTRRFFAIAKNALLLDFNEQAIGLRNYKLKFFLKRKRIFVKSFQKKKTTFSFNFFESILCNL